jgi:hypothetical protein
MPDNHKLVADLIATSRDYYTKKSGYDTYAASYALGTVEQALADTLTELEINHPKTYQARVEYINNLIQKTMEQTND